MNPQVTHMYNLRVYDFGCIKNTCISIFNTFYLKLSLSLIMSVSKKAALVSVIFSLIEITDLISHCMGCRDWVESHMFIMTLKGHYGSDQLLGTVL